MSAISDSRDRGSPYEILDVPRHTLQERILECQKKICTIRQRITEIEKQEPDEKRERVVLQLRSDLQPLLLLDQFNREQNRRYWNQIGSKYGIIVSSL